MRLIRILLAIVALASQLASGAIAAPDRGADPIARLRAAMVICHAPAIGVAARDDRHHRENRHLSCPTQVSLALPGYVLTPVPSLPVRGAALVVRSWAPLGARAPPSHAVGVPPSTGPPVLT